MYNDEASGGMDNMATVYDLNNRDSTGVAKVIRELAGYDGFLSCCRFLSDQKLLTGSGDMKMCIYIRNFFINLVPPIRI
jgi:guanine nucleotide-binding protein subunit beta